MYQKEKIKKGVRVRVKSRDGVFEGNVKYWNPISEDLTIEPGYCLENRKNIADELNFYKNDLECVITLDDIESETTMSTTSSDEKSSCNDIASLERENVVGRNRYTVVKPLHNNKNTSTAIDFKAFQYYWITESTSILTFLKLIAGKKIQVIGLRLYGKLTRDGYISLICIEADKLVYVFDMMAIRSEPEESENDVYNLLAEILGDPDVIKVMYNCSFASDILYHQYRISLRNVFDLEAAFAYVHTNIASKVNIELLIQQNLANVETSKVSMSEINDMKKIDWSKRPLNSVTKYIALRESSVLIQLYRIYYDKIFDRFSKGCELYLTIVKNCQNGDERDQLYQNDEQVIAECQRLYNPKREVTVERRINKCASLNTRPLSEIDPCSAIIQKRIDLMKSSPSSKTEDDSLMGSTKSVFTRGFGLNTNKDTKKDESVNSMRSIFHRPLHTETEFNPWPAGAMKIRTPGSKANRAANMSH